MSIIAEISGDILTSNAQVITCPVNCVGVMGAGLALEMKRRIPGLFQAYRQACNDRDIRIGQCWTWDTHVKNRSVLCFPTKDCWTRRSTPEMVELAFQSLIDNYVDWGIRSLAIPMVGCGYGGLDWNNDVRHMLYDYLDKTQMDVTVYIH